MEFKTVGDVMQSMVVQMEHGEEVKAEAGSMIYMSDGIQIDTKITGGLMAGLGRMFSGSTLFFTHFRCQSPSGMVAFAAHYPGHVRELHLQGNGWICAKESFLFSTTDVDIQIAFTKKLGFGFFGGTGFILQRIAGNGVAYIHGGGNLVDYDLAPGQRIKVEAGCLVAFQDSVNYDIEFIGGIKNALFGGEGLFLATLTGPGRVTISTLPFARLAGAILSMAQIDTRSGGTAGAIGSVIGGLLGGDS